MQKAIDVLGSQKKLAEQAGISQAAVHKLLYGKCSPTLDTVIGIEEATKGAVLAADFLSEYQRQAQQLGPS